MSTVKVTRFIVKAGDGSKVTFASKREAIRYAKRCGSAKVLTIPVSR